MRPEQLNGKKVIDTNAGILGEISGIEVDMESWSIKGVYVKLDDDSIVALGFRKPRLRGKVEIFIPNSLINAISDMVALNKNHQEIKELLVGKTIKITENP